MHDEQLKAVLDGLVPAHAGDPRREEAGWRDVQRRVRRLRRRRRSLLVATAALAALFSTLAAAGQIGSFAPHSKAPHLIVRGTLYTQKHERARGRSRSNSNERRSSSDAGFVSCAGGCRPTTASAPAGFSTSPAFPAQPSPAARCLSPARRNRLCGPCGTRASGELELSATQATALVNDEVTFTGATQHTTTISGAVRLDHSRLQRGVMCIQGAKGCTRVYTGSPVAPPSSTRSPSSLPRPTRESSSLGACSVTAPVVRTGTRIGSRGSRVGRGGGHDPLG